MRRFFTFIRKEFAHVLRDRKTLLILFGMPVVQILIFGFALTNEVKNARIVIMDQANDAASRRIISKLETSSYFEIGPTVMNHRQMEDAFKRGDIRLALIFPAGFNDNLLHQQHASVQIIADASDPNNAATLTSYVSAIIQDYLSETKRDNEAPYQIQPQVRYLYNPQLKGAPNFVPGVMSLVLMLVCVMMTAVSIRKLVAVSPGWALTYILAFVGILSSIAADAGYVVLIPLAGAAFLSLGRNPLAGLALGFAAVGGAFNVNMLIKPLDAVLTEITNDAIHMVDPSVSISLTAGLWFSIASVLLLTVVIALVTERIIEPRLGKFQPASGEAAGDRAKAAITPEESRGLRFAMVALVGVLVVFGLLTIPSAAPLRNPDTGALIGNSPFMNALIVPIMLLFLATGIAYGRGAGTMKSAGEVIGAMTKAVSSLGGTILLFLVISQFIAYFNYSNIPTLLAVNMADALKTANIGPLWLLLGFILVVTALNFVFTPAIAKWAIFAPVFVPLFVTLGVDPAAVLSAYRVGDSPTNALTPLNAYFALVVGFAQVYDKKAGIGTVVALLLPYAIWMTVVWMVLFAAWYGLGLPWGF